MKMSLMSKNKLEFVDGTIGKPNAANPLYSSWRRCNNMVLSWLIRLLSPSIAQTAIAFETAQLLWENLRERFAQSDVYRLADLQIEIFTISQGNKSVTDYFASLQILWDKFTNLNPLAVCVCECFCNIATTMSRKQETNLIICFLKVLIASFSNVKSQIMTMDPMATMNKVFSLLLQFEREFIVLEKDGHTQDIASFVIRRNNYQGYQGQGSRSFLQNRQNNGNGGISQ